MSDWQSLKGACHVRCHRVLMPVLSQEPYLVSGGFSGPAAVGCMALLARCERLEGRCLLASAVVCAPAAAGSVPVLPSLSP